VNGKLVGIKKSTLRNKCYIFGVPLSYMKKNDSRQLMTKVLEEIF